MDYTTRYTEIYACWKCAGWNDYVCDAVFIEPRIPQTLGGGSVNLKLSIWSSPKKIAIVPFENWFRATKAGDSFCFFMHIAVKWRMKKQKEIPAQEVQKNIDNKKTTVYNLLKESNHNTIILDIEAPVVWKYRTDAKGSLMIMWKPNTLAQYLRSVCQFFRWTATN